MTNVERALAALRQTQHYDGSAPIARIWRNIHQAIEALTKPCETCGGHREHRTDGHWHDDCPMCVKARQGEGNPCPNNCIDGRVPIQ